MAIPEMVKPIDVLNKMIRDCSIIVGKSGILLTHISSSGIFDISQNENPGQEQERKLLELKKLKANIKGVLFALKRGIIECYLTEDHDDKRHLIFKCKTYNSIIPVDAYSIDEWIKVIKFYTYSLIDQRVNLFNSKYCESIKCSETIEDNLSDRTIFMSMNIYREDWKFLLMKSESAALTIAKTVRGLLNDLLYKPYFSIIVPTEYPKGIDDYLYSFGHTDISVLAVYATVKFYVVIQTDFNDMVKIGIWFSKYNIRTSFCSMKNIKISLDIIDFCRDQLNRIINPLLLTYSMAMTHYSEILVQLNNIEQEESNKNKKKSRKKL
jgi:hypothetical protein